MEKIKIKGIILVLLLVLGILGLNTKYQKYRNEKNNEKLPDYSEELSKLNEIDNGIKRKEYYSFIKFLVDNSINGIDYTKVNYENKRWLIQGEIEKFDNFEKFESNVRKKYENSELGYIKDNDETTVFEYTVSEKE